VTNTTFAFNVFRNPGPGGPENNFGIVIANRGGIAAITNSTLANNTGPAGNLNNATVYSGPSATTTLQNTIVARNTDSNGIPVRDCTGTVASGGNNIIGNPVGCAIDLQPSDITGDPGLGPFTDNGRPGNGHFPLLHTSRAIDAANDAVCPKKDQIGQPRKPHCDIGAIEFSHHHNPNDTDELVHNVP